MEEELRIVCNKSCDVNHVIENSAETGEKFEPNVRKLSTFLKINGGNFKDPVCEIGGQSGYGLRENPKKTWRAGVRIGGFPKLPLQQQQQKDQICKQCGKGFQSLKALCGHMACHSEKDKVLRDDHSWSTIEKNQKMGFDNQSDTEAEPAGPRRRRPKRAASMRYKRISVRSSCSSAASEIDHEQEEVAMCLMMLSRDYGKWVGFDSVGESSDNNSAVLETTEMKIRREQLGVSSVKNSAERKRKLKSGELWESKAVQFDNSDSGYYSMNEAGKVDSDVSVDGFLRNGNFKKQKVENGSGLVKGLNKGKFKGIELKKGLAEGKRCGESGKGSDFVKFDSRRKKNESGSKKKQDFCLNERISKLKSKKSRGHECPVCHKVYKSGQALGGHKKSHFLGVSSEERNNQISVTKQEFSEPPDLIDLNLPVSLDEEEANELSQFMPW